MLISFQVTAKFHKYGYASKFTKRGGGGSGFGKKWKMKEVSQFPKHKDSKKVSFIKIGPLMRSWAMRDVSEGEEEEEEEEEEEGERVLHEKSANFKVL